MKLGPQHVADRGAYCPTEEDIEAAKRRMRWHGFRPKRRDVSYCEPNAAIPIDRAEEDFAGEYDN